MSGDRIIKYRTHKDFTLSEIGLGCYALSGVYGPKDPDQFKTLLVKAYELGVTFFDVAEGYGEAELILGEAIRSILPSQDSPTTFVDLLYVIETASQLKIFSEHDGMQLIQELFALRSAQNGIAKQEMLAIKNHLAGIFKEYLACN